ncbi:hypothetical protein [Asticcacaulis sp.]|uniref:hypothetical protein n=1 Tax=Asticcacaulis sp. TaxID=1872648 RepID=UPI00262BF7A2|nr:hypothetical protein [Asticcacaulis sp.]
MWLPLNLGFVGFQLMVSEGGTLEVIMEATYLLAIPRRLFTSRRVNRLMSEGRLPPLKPASIGLAKTGDRPGRDTVESRMAGVVPLIGRFRRRHQHFTSNQWLSATPASLVNFSDQPKCDRLSEIFHQTEYW